MPDLKALAVCCFLCYSFVAYVLIIAASSWMINVNNSGSWRDTINKAFGGDNAKVNELTRSWQRLPFVDVHVTTESYCPQAYPDDLV